MSAVHVVHIFCVVEQMCNSFKLKLNKDLISGINRSLSKNHIDFKAGNKKCKNVNSFISSEYILLENYISSRLMYL